jgi:hypothetical protein
VHRVEIGKGKTQKEQKGEPTTAPIGRVCNGPVTRGLHSPLAAPGSASWWGCGFGTNAGRRASEPHLFLGGAFTTGQATQRPPPPKKRNCLRGVLGLWAPRTHPPPGLPRRLAAQGREGGGHTTALTTCVLYSRPDASRPGEGVPRHVTSATIHYVQRRRRRRDEAADSSTRAIGNPKEMPTRGEIRAAQTPCAAAAPLCWPFLAFPA